VEIRVPFTNLERTPGTQSLSLGFDIGIEDSDSTYGPVGYQAWRATSYAAPAPSMMGNLALAVAPIPTNLVFNPGFDSAIVNTSYPGFAEALLHIQKGGRIKNRTEVLSGLKGSGSPAVRNSAP
jgi:hypothetical protein